MPINFVDLFAGIGGIRIGFESAGFKCVFSSELDKYCRETYNTFFFQKPENHDIKQITESKNQIIDNIPNHTILTGGFPCQPFSLAGVSRKTQ